MYHLRTCPDEDVTFFLYSKSHPEKPEEIKIGPRLFESNLEQTSFDPGKPTKIIVHGYNSNMNLSALVEIRKGRSIVMIIVIAQMSTHLLYLKILEKVDFSFLIIEKQLRLDYS